MYSDVFRHIALYRAVSRRIALYRDPRTNLMRFKTGAAGWRRRRGAYRDAGRDALDQTKSVDSLVQKDLFHDGRTWTRIMHTTEFGNGRHDVPISDISLLKPC